MAETSVGGGASDGTSERLSELIDKLTTSGRSRLDKPLITELKQICRQSEGYLWQAHRLLLAQLEREHAEVRRSAVQVIDELFQRSHCFRELLLADLQLFMELTLETDVTQLLPPPLPVALELKHMTARIIHDWHAKFGDAYKLLALGYHFLSTCKKIDFESARAAGAVERARAEGQRERRTRVNEARRERVLEEIRDLSGDIRACLTEAESCLTLLLPHPDHFHVICPPTPPSTLHAAASLGPNKLPLPDANPLPNEPSLPAATPLPNDPRLPAAESSYTDSVASGHIDFSHSDSVPIKSAHTDSVAPGPIESSCSSDPDAGSDCESACSPSPAPEDRLSPAPEGRRRGVLSDCESTNAPSPVPEGRLSPDPEGRLSPAPEDRRQGMLSDCELVRAPNPAPEGRLSPAPEGQLSPAPEGRHHGVLSHTFTLSVVAPPRDWIEIEESDNNTDILRTLRDQRALIEHKFASTIKRWIEVLIRTEAREGDVRAVLDLKRDLDRVFARINLLHTSSSTALHQGTVSHPSDSDSDDAGDYVEVSPKEWHELSAAATQSGPWGVAPAARRQGTASSGANKRVAGCGSEAALRSDSKGSVSGGVRAAAAAGSAAAAGPSAAASFSEQHSLKEARRKALLKQAPVVPYGNDLYHWGADFEAPLVQRKEADSHRWWALQGPEDAVDINALRDIKQRVIDFPGVFEPVKWKCRAPLPSGLLCQRMDRKKCPFHGVIIARDELGVPKNPNEVTSTQIVESRTGGCASWEDPELQAEILAATGIDVSRKGKQNGKQKKKQGGLTDIGVLHRNTARKRLESKVFKSSTMKRVANSIAKHESKLFNDKYANNFNYAFKQ